MGSVLRASLLSLPFFGLGMGCAHAPPPSPPAAVSEAPAASAEPSADRKEAERLSIPATHIEGGRGLVRLCDTFRDSANMTFTGSAVEQARQREAHEQRRLGAADDRYEIDVPAGGFSFDGYDLAEGKLRLADRRFAIDEGIEIDRPSTDEAIGFPLSDAGAERILQMHAEKKLTLRLVFQPQASQMRPEMCIRQSGGRMLKLGAQLLAAYVVGPAGAPLATYQTEAFAQVMADLTPVQTPRVKVGKAVSGDATPISAAAESTLAKLEAPLLGCYREALARRATTQGTVIVGLRLNKDGRAQQARMEMSTISDERLVACAAECLGKTSFPTSTPLPEALSVPLTFGETTTP